MTLVICNSRIIHISSLVMSTAKLTDAFVNTVTHDNVLTALYLSNVDVQTSLCVMFSQMWWKRRFCR